MSCLQSAQRKVDSLGCHEQANRHADLLACTVISCALRWILTLAKPPMRRISLGDVHTRSHTNTGSADASSSLQKCAVQPQWGGA